jgi:hypothetical protein
VSNISDKKSVIVTTPSPERSKPLVGVSAQISFTDLPRAVSALVGLGASANVRLANLTDREMRSALTTLNQTTEVVSAAISLRGTKPLK